MKMGVSETLRKASDGNFDEKIDDAEWLTSSGIRDLNTCLQASGNHNVMLLIGEEFNISFQFGAATIHHFFDHGTMPRSNFLGDTSSLTTTYLRRVFTFFEYVVFYLCKYPNRVFDHSYNEQSEQYAERLRHLKETGKIRKDVEATLRSLKQTRDQFAHSFVEIGDLTYKGIPLSESSQDFFTDIDETSVLLERLFLEQQHFQIDWRIFSLVHQALRTARIEGIRAQT
ncbi:hypothetical protein [Marivita sp.]|uniref:hypothetical protein n=1 Tax=Marivita sp. TaxID=2003365 RepID=UPI003F6F9E9B